MIERKTLLKVSKTSYPAQLHCEEYNDKSPYCFELGDISVSVHLGAKSPGCAIISSNVKGPLNEPCVLIQYHATQSDGRGSPHYGYTYQPWFVKMFLPMNLMI